jgi:hypothetical protein
MASEDRPLVWSHQAYAQLQAWQRNIGAVIDQRVNAALASNPSFREKDVRVGVAVAYDPEDEEAEFPTTGKTFWVQLARPTYAPLLGDNPLDIVPYDPPVYRMVFKPQGDLPEEGDTVWLILIHGQYYVIPDGQQSLPRKVRFKLLENFNGGNTSAEFFEWDGTPIPPLVEGVPDKLSDPEWVGEGLFRTNRGYALFDEGIYKFDNARCPVEPEEEE